MIRRPPRSTRTEHTLSLHDALPIYRHGALEPLSSPDIDRQVNLLVLEHPVSVVRVQTGIADTALDHFEVQFQRSEEHTSELQSLMRISYAVFCLKKKKQQYTQTHITYYTKLTIHATITQHKL